MNETNTAPAGSEADAADTIEINVPLGVQHAATLRVIVTSLGSDNGLTVDEIDDVKLAVSEVFTLLVDDADEVGATRAHIGFTASHGTITITLHRGLDDERLELDVLATTILASVVDRHVVDTGCITLVKHAAEANA